MAVAEVKQLRHDKRENAAVAIQSKWRARAASDAYLLMLVDIILVQSVARRFIAHKSVARLQEEIEFNAATTISSTWRRHTCLRQYRRTVSGAYLSDFHLLAPMASDHIALFLVRYYHLSVHLSSQRSQETSSVAASNKKRGGLCWVYSRYMESLHDSRTLCKSGLQHGTA
jgi:hypothetical protein